jgi:hypothetical protein
MTDARLPMTADGDALSNDAGAVWHLVVRELPGRIHTAICKRGHLPQVRVRTQRRETLGHQHEGMDAKGCC